MTTEVVGQPLHIPDFTDHPKRDSVVTKKEIQSDVAMCMALQHQLGGSNKDKTITHLKKWFPDLLDHLSLLTTKNSEKVRAINFLYGDRLPIDQGYQVLTQWEAALQAHTAYQDRPQYKYERKRVRLDAAVDSLKGADKKRWTRMKFILSGVGATAALIATGTVVRHVLSSKANGEGEFTAAPPATEDGRLPSPPPDIPQFTPDQLAAIENGSLYTGPQTLMYASDHPGEFSFNGIKLNKDWSERHRYIGSVIDLTLLESVPEQLVKEQLRVPFLLSSLADDYGARAVAFTDSVHNDQIDVWLAQLELTDPNGKTLQLKDIKRLDTQNAYVKAPAEEWLIGEPLLVISDNDCMVLLPRESTTERLGHAAYKFANLKSERQWLEAESHRELDYMINFGGPTGSVLIVGGYQGKTTSPWLARAGLVSLVASWPYQSNLEVSEAITLLGKWGVTARPEEFQVVEQEGFSLGGNTFYLPYREVDDNITRQGLYTVASKLAKLAHRVTITPSRDLLDFTPYPFTVYAGRLYPSENPVTQEKLRQQQP